MLRAGIQVDSPITFADFFCGIGGTRLAFEGRGRRCVFSCEWDPRAQTTYEANFHERPVGDINDVDPKSVPDHDILLAGFPCQPFSIAGVSKKNSLGCPHGFLDRTQGTLFFSLARIIEARRPRAFLLENVKNLLHHDRGWTFQTILGVLRDDLGYRVYHRVIDASCVVPQRRQRVYIVGFANDVDFEFPSLRDRHPRLGDILERNVDPKYTLSDHLWAYLQAYARKHREKGNGFGFGLTPPDGIARTLSARYYKDGSEILVPQRGRNPRRLTPRECARLMGFRDSFVIPVADTWAYKQFGNSVVVPVVRAIRASMLQAMRGAGTRSRKRTMRQLPLFAVA